MTFVVMPDSVSTPEERRSWKLDIASYIREVAQVPLNLPPDQIDVREALVGGTAVTTAQTGLAVDQLTGSAVDLVINTATTTTVAWLESAASVTAFTLSSILNAAVQTRTPQTKVIAFYGFVDKTVVGDLDVLQFTSGKNIKAWIETETVYEPNEQNLIGGYFMDEESGQPASIVYGRTLQEPISIFGIWESSAAKNLVLRTLIAEKAGTTITAAPAIRTLPGQPS